MRLNRKELKEIVLRANLELPAMGLVLHTWGNVSQIDRETGEVAIKPSGVAYGGMSADDIVIVDLDGNTVEGRLNPSSDLATHLALYRAFARIGGIVHTHSTHATVWAQACREIPCLGTTHADTFYGPIPVTRDMLKEEIEGEYELNTGKVIIERFSWLDPSQVPGVLVAGHGPFSWGADAQKAVYNASVMEEVAKMAIYTEALSPQGAKTLSQELLDRHFLRKHGEGAYYGQKE